MESNSILKFVFFVCVCGLYLSNLLLINYTQINFQMQQSYFKQKFLIYLKLDI